MRLVPDQRGIETVQLSVEESMAIEREAWLDRAVDLKDRIAAAGNLDDAATIAWLIRRAVR